MRYLLLLCVIPLCTFQMAAPEPAPAKREFRAAWVVHIFNIDWPSAPGLPPARQRAEFTALLDSLAATGLNAVIVQIRPTCDALYPSRFDPWSEWLTGKPGQPPSPYYDPLGFMVAETHRRGLEFHAWITPFRAVTHTRFRQPDSTHISRRRPDWCMSYGPSRWLNPGLPAVRTWTAGVVMEIVHRYPVDGIHFDENLYPPHKADTPLQDSAAWRQYGQGFADINAWRRDNLNQFIREVADSLRATAPWVKFGISPVSTWRNLADDPLGSESEAWFTSYDDLYSDVRHWLAAGWIDYVAPQMYTDPDNPRVRYRQVMPWWTQNTFGRHMYAGLPLFRLQPGEAAWPGAGPLLSQLAYNRTRAGIQGHIFYSASSFRGNPHQIRDLLQVSGYQHPALVPAMPWKDSIPPLGPHGLTLSRTAGGLALSWAATGPASDGDLPARYVLYRFPAQEPIDLDNPARILAVTPLTTWLDTVPDTTATYVVTALDRLQNESLTCAAGVVR
ncbi:MAG: family 10 glycosylhydrolase [Bacteroidia bacterium]|nr:family 10 glycosylhydrolase [Bacteroidia bacterium]